MYILKRFPAMYLKYVGCHPIQKICDAKSERGESRHFLKSVIDEKQEKLLTEFTILRSADRTLFYLPRERGSLKKKFPVHIIGKCYRVYSVIIIYAVHVGPM